jgi:protein-disulfide isomerase
MALSKKNLTISIVGGIVVIVVVLKMTMFNSTVEVDPVEARSKGPAQARVHIVEFIDFECPACAYGVNKIKGYLEKYPHDLRVEVKHYPLTNMHRHALKSASYAECMARQDKFWPFIELVMAQQSQWSPLMNVEGMFDQFAENTKANMGQLKSCLSSEDVTVKIQSEKAIGRSLGVQSTPTYFVNKKMMVGTKSLQEELDLLFPKSP